MSSEAPPKLLSTAEVIDNYNADEAKLIHWAKMNRVQLVGDQYVWTPHDLSKLDLAYSDIVRAPKCSSCEKEAPCSYGSLGAHGWVTLEVINGDCGLDVCDECMKSDESMKSSLDAFLEEYREICSRCGCICGKHVFEGCGCGKCEGFVGGEFIEKSIEEVAREGN